MPYSRATIAVCEVRPPTSVTKPLNTLLLKWSMSAGAISEATRTRSLPSMPALLGFAVRSADGGRLLAVMSVDGVNILSGQTAGWPQSAMCEGRWTVRKASWKPQAKKPSTSSQKPWCENASESAPRRLCCGPAPMLDAFEARTGARMALTVTGAGGVGKSAVATLLAQYRLRWGTR